MYDSPVGEFKFSRGEWTRPDPVVKVYWIAKAVMPLTIIVIFLGLFMVSVGEDLVNIAICFIIWGIAFLVAYVWAVLFYRSYIYRIGKGGVEINRGILFKSNRTIPYERIQHITVTRGPLMSIFGISDLNLFTAGTGSLGSSAASRGMFGAEGFIPGVKNPAPLRETIMKSMELSKSGAGLGDEVHRVARAVQVADDPMHDLLHEVRAIRAILMRRKGEELVEIDEQLGPPEPLRSLSPEGLQPEEENGA